MSSRRKSRPVRRLDMICSKLQDGQGNSGDAPGWLSHEAHNGSWLSHEVHNGNNDVMEGNGEQPIGGSDSPSMEDESSLAAREGDEQGVYVLQPEGVDDDDDDEMRLAKPPSDTKSQQRRKRSHEENSPENSNRHKEYEPWSGLDLSVKRPRTEAGRDSRTDSEKGALRSKSTSPNMFSDNGEGTSADIKDQLEKYHHLMTLVDQQKPLAQAMEEVGLTIQEFFALHRLNNQLSSSRQDRPQTSFIENPKILSAPPTISTVFDKFSPKEQTGTMPMADEWITSKENHEAKIQALLKEANEDVIQQQKKSSEAQQLSSSRLQQQPTTLNPSMTAALMASLANPDQNSEERQGLLRNLFLKAQGFLSQGSTPNKSMDDMMSANNSPSMLDRSSSSKNDSITAGTVSSGVGSIKKGTLDPSSFDEDVFDQYIAKFTNINRCASMTCPYFTRDHYHCVVEDCNYQRFTNKADVIRHYNMHKKRDNSLAHGFLRFSPTEDCSSKYSSCHLNGKSTHYHCMQPDCNKVYTSTSDVMTHENFHKKYMQFVCSGFKRFRATEQCDLASCIFRNQKTTHFHCTRTDCNFSFKNKCDIEKHKTYHMRDDSYLSKGFKKFYKNEACSNNECVWNYTANHFHCLRSGCNFSFTSTSQMESHKRKHDRNEFLTENPDSKPSTSHKSTPSSHEMALPPRKPTTPNVSHYKLPPRTLKFTQFVPPKTSSSTPLKFTHFVPPATSAVRRESIRVPPNVTHMAPPYYPRRGHLPLLLSPKRTPVAMHGRNGPLVVPGSLGLSSLPHTAERPYLSHSLLSPFSPYMAAVASRCITNNLQGSSSQNSPKMPMFNPALFQEAARKILASMPAGSVAHGFSGLSAAQQQAAKSEASQGDSVFSRPQSGSVSPSTPAGSSRSFSIGGFPTAQSEGATITTKEELSWKAPSSFAESLQSNERPYAGVTSNGESPLRVGERSRSMLEVSKAEWPRAGGVISPSMALSAAAALKPGNQHVYTTATDRNDENSMKLRDADPHREEEAERSQLQDAEKDDKSLAVTGYSDRQKILKYFAGASAFNCWIQNCDFFAKQHFHCLVENCEAMFTTPENVIKHTKFHENLESMVGAALPIQSAVPDKTLTKALEFPKPKADDIASTPPPGYIALQSGMAKSRPSVIDFEPASTSRAMAMSPVASKADFIPTSASIKQENAVNPFTLGALPFTQSQAQMPTLATQLYAAALLKGVGTPSSASETPVTQPLTSTPLSTYKLLQNQASLSALMGHVAQAAASQSAADPTSAPGAAVPSDLDQSLYLGKKPEGGYINFKTGMPCLRRDCKYIHQNHWHCTMNRCRYVCKSLGKAQTHRQAHDSLEVYARSAKLCFRSYSVKKKCPNPNCEFRLRGHYHCLKAGCQFSTIGTSKLPWHMKKHEKIARREASGFKYYTKKEQCGHFDCKYNGLFSHYHCIRTGCTFAFQYKHQMSTHVRKHLRRMLGRSYTGDMQDIDHTNVDSGDDSLPLIIDEMDEAEQGPGVRLSEEQLLAQDQDRLSKQQLEVLERMTKQMKSSYAAFTSSQGNVTEQELVSTIIGQKAADSRENEEQSDGHSVGYQEALDLSSMAPGSSKLNDTGAHHQSHDMESLHEDSNSNGFGNTTDEADVNMDGENDDSSSRTSHSPPVKTSPGRGPYVAKFKLGEDVMNGFQRFEANDECGDDKCAYMYKVSHYHCIRENCFYRFTGRTHMFKHQQHHDRVAGLVRDDFKRFKASNPCEDEQCEFRGKNTHFHCLRCDFRCTDSAKVGTHRRQHIKADTLEQSGFQRVRGKDDCGRVDCKYRCRNMSHFHCLQPGCSYAIVGLTGIELHAEKHKRGLLQTPATSQSSNTDFILQNLGVFQTMRQQLLGVTMGEHAPHSSMDEAAGHNLSLPALAAIREMQDQLAAKPQQPTSPPSSSENGLSNQLSPFVIPSSNDTPPLLSKFSLLGASSPAQGVIVTAASSPVSTTTMVAEGVGS